MKPAPSVSIRLTQLIQRSRNSRCCSTQILNTQDPESGNILPSALIPFCAYQSNLTTLGTTIPGFSFPVCTAFQPTLLHGQLCYSLDMESMLLEGEREKTIEGIGGGILIIVDPNSERSETGGAEVLRKLGSKNRLNLSPKSQLGGSAIVNIHTLIRQFRLIGF